MKTFEPPNLIGVKHLVFDVETTGVDWKRDQVVGYVLATDSHSWYYPVRHEGGGNCDARLVEAWLRAALANPELHVIGHNLKFDLHMAANHRIRMGGSVECTMVNAALIDENQGQYNLDFVGNLYPEIPKKNVTVYEYMASKFGGEPTRKAQIGNFWKLAGDDPHAVEYATGDGLTTWGVWQEQQKQLDADALRPVWEVECGVTKVLFKMERRGVRIDEEVARRVKAQLEVSLEEAKRALPNGFNVRSTRQISEFLAGRMGEAAPPKTPPSPTYPAGQESYTAAFLGSVAAGQPILRVRKLSNLLNTFLNPLLDQHLFKGRIHTTFNQLRQDDFGTVTGRLSSSDPNEQQVPKRDKALAPLFRQTHLPEEGHLWSSNDYSQQEFRAFADYTGSERLINGYKATPPMDIHSTVGELLGVSRDPAKIGNFTILYGGGADRLAGLLGVSVLEAKSFLDRYHAMLPEARKFLKEAEFWARKRGWVRTRLYRRRRFPDARHAYKAGNAIIQGSSADMTKLKMVEIDRLFESNKAESALMLQVHDELCWTVAPGEEKLNEQARRIMESFGPNDKMQFTVPITVESRLAKNWALASFPEWREELGNQ